MQRKTLLSACIALALSGQGWAADITEIETTTGEKKNTNVTCPADPGKLSPEELKRLPSECSSVVEQNLMPWLVTGAATALITTLAIVELNDDDDHHRNNSPLPPTPPDDDSDDTPVPPTPGGDEIIPDDGPDDTPTPPKPIAFNNDVILDKTEKTLTIRDSVFSYTENADGTISLQDSNGRKATINLWQIDETNNTVALEGMSADGATKWQYNHNGELVITGDNTTVNNTGKTIVDGKGATGTEIAGNNAVVNQDGELDVSGGGHGIDITGDSATVINKGNITVTDKDSVGVLINGDRATFANTGHIDVNNSATGMSITTSEGAISQAGSMNVGDFSTGMALSGNNNSVTLAAKDLNVIGQKATGVNISGDNNAVDITGNILVDKDQTATNAVDYFYEPSIGVNVSGNSNTVSLDGKLTVVADSELTSRIYADFDGSQENISGLVVSGDDNTVYLNGGIQLVGEENQLTDGSTVASNRNGYGKTPVITVDGKSSVYLNGDSTINGDLPLAYSGMIRLKNSAMIEIGADATINMQVDIYDHYARSESQMIFVESGAELVNKGDIDTRNIGFAAISGENSTGSNSGNITLSQYNYGLLANAGVGYFTTKGGSAVNNGTITAKVMEQESVINLGASLGLNEANTFYSDANSMMGLDAFDHGYVSNESGGSIEMYGRGNVGMLAIDESTAENAGQITLDALWVDADDTTTLRSNIGNDARSYGVGMAVGTNTYSGPRKNATAVNKQGGVITVYNAGIGMAAYGASNTVINEGIINLEKNANYDSSLGADSLIGMAAYKSGTAINEQSGVININADNGQAFYSDGSGTILNYGTICVNTNCLTGNDYNETDSYTSLLYTGGDVITAQNETQNLTQKASINDKKEGNVVNSGSLSGADIAISSGELVNTSTGTINNAIIINDGELSNEGSVAKVTLNAGTFGNTGTVNSRMFQTGGTFNNQQGGVVQNGANLSKTAITNNEGTWYLGASSSSDSN
ncbi:TPA: beta strand repeat-containing protein, partial [Escherichia coli]|nr:EntS/YbdA MFS transporter [Escherichia coli]EHJ6777248.1 EntS/YbdA MFS transporter [Escherichia coli]EHM1975328.1 EntS/YbdA MFS transporter [Escherichia coli]EHY7669793.1 EntS/YbdA MFS transporter [Escherichia coli]EIA9951905.1 EntS/YbdA MFS transporter [Escherichia coli]